VPLKAARTAHVTSLAQGILKNAQRKGIGIALQTPTTENLKNKKAFLERTFLSSFTLFYKKFPK